MKAEPAWAERNKGKLEAALQGLADRFDEKPKPSSGKKTYSALVSFYHCNMGGKAGEALTNGTALYYAKRDRDGGSVSLLHGTRLDVVVLPRRAFDEVTDIWWPAEARSDTTGVHCDPLKYADSLVRQAEAHRQMNKSFPGEFVREAVADLRGVPLEQVAKFKPNEKEKVTYMNRVNSVKERAKKLAEQWDETDEVEQDEEEETTPIRKTKTGKAAKAAKESNVKASKKAKVNGKAKAASNGTRTTVEHDVPKVGKTFDATYKGKEFQLKVVKGDDGGVKYAVGKKTFKSPSAAGKFVMDGGACNGWRFRGIESA